MQRFKGKLTGGLGIIIALAVVFAISISATKTTPAARPKDNVKNTNAIPATENTSLYAKLHLKELGLAEKAYQLALTGWEKLKVKGQISKNIISICDFTQSSGNKRLYIIDLATGTLLFNTLVAHGKNTGDEFARYFSNQPSSLQSSLGFFVTGEAYTGKHGLGMRLNGQEPGFNDKAAERTIVMHGADYVCDAFIDQWGRLGRSFGCPAVPSELHEQIINTIKDGSCLFIYYPDKKYLAFSKLIK
ncbi:MAG: hypothetical protein JWO06_2624 [Bacteroidota bacterium]|nr:hypothetical protein [Bacteroidota bacterium]